MSPIGRTILAVRARLAFRRGAVPCLAPVPLVAGRPRGRYGPAYALEFRVSPNVWIVPYLHL
ncbi:MAG: hypothetical protein FJX74_00815 [Armatimonadetes bacterium]|nr:hypothetical protein [Armatimonadota bacterium]